MIRKGVQIENTSILYHVLDGTDFGHLCPIQPGAKSGNDTDSARPTLRAEGPSLCDCGSSLRQPSNRPTGSARPVRGGSLSRIRSRNSIRNLYRQLLWRLLCHSLRRGGVGRLIHDHTIVRSRFGSSASVTSMKPRWRIPRCCKERVLIVEVA